MNLTSLHELTRSLIELDDLSNEIERLEQDTEADPVRLAKINNRLDNLYSLIQKHRLKNLDELILKKEEIENIIKSIVTGDERLDELADLLKNSTDSLKVTALKKYREEKICIA